MKYDWRRYAGIEIMIGGARLEWENYRVTEYNLGTSAAISHILNCNAKTCPLEQTRPNIRYHPIELILTQKYINAKTVGCRVNYLSAPSHVAMLSWVGALVLVTRVWDAWLVLVTGLM